FDFGAEGGAHARQPLAPGLRRLRGYVAHAAALDSEVRSRIAGRVPALGELLQLGVARRNIDLDAHQLVAALAVPAHEAPVLEPERLARGRTLGDGQHDCAFRRRYLHFGAEHCLLERDRKIEANIVALAREEAMRRNLNGDDRIAA